MKLQSNQNPLQYALFQAAKVGHVKLMREFIMFGGNPFALDDYNNDAFSYSKLEAPDETEKLLMELRDGGRYA